MDDSILTFHRRRHGFACQTKELLFDNHQSGPRVRHDNRDVANGWEYHGRRLPRFIIYCNGRGLSHSSEASPGLPTHGAPRAKTTAMLQLYCSRSCSKLTFLYCRCGVEHPIGAGYHVWRGRSHLFSGSVHQSHSQGLSVSELAIRHKVPPPLCDVCPDGQPAGHS